MARRNRNDNRNLHIDSWDGGFGDDKNFTFSDNTFSDNPFGTKDEFAFPTKGDSGLTAGGGKKNPLITLAVVLLAAIVLVGGAFGIRALLNSRDVNQAANVSEAAANPMPGENQNTSPANQQAATPAPAAPQAPWTGLDFETADLEGNTIRSRDLFSQHTMTMVNVWASWCPPCVGELPELQRLNGEFADKNCAIVGILLDGAEAQGLADGKARLREAGATYTILLPWDGVDNIFPVSAIPTSFFVDSQGHVIGEPIVGAYVDGYTPALDAAIAATQG